jgi:hypothetical protein
MITNQSFSYTGSDEYSLSDIQLSDLGVSLYDTLTGVGGDGYMPYDGSTVTVKTSPITSDSSIKKLEPSLSNKVYYLVSDIKYTDQDKDTILSLSTEIVMTFVTDRYEGTFVFNNPNNYKYLYLIWDYTDRMNGDIVTYSGNATTRYVEMDLGTDVGNMNLNINTNGVPSRFILKYNDESVLDTGYIGLNSTSNYNNLIALGIADDDISLQEPLDGLVNNGIVVKNFNKR